VSRPSAQTVVRRALLDSIAVKSALVDGYVPVVTHLADYLVGAFRAGHKLVLFGNGGSAADAQHVAAEFVNMRSGSLPAIALTTDSSALTAIGNDVAFDAIFARQVQALVTPGDVVVGISTSGNSRNVLHGVRVARARGALTVGMTGERGGELKGLVDLCLCVPSAHVGRIQEAHIAVWHAVCEVVEAAVARSV
jgi:D-sedoheptulose 7-phosphate isomerase